MPLVVSSLFGNKKKVAIMKKVCIIGSGNWGCAIARIVGNNVSNFKEFHNTVKMYVFEEIVNERKLSEIINTQHENIKYLPGFEIPSNVIAIPDLLEAASDADILIWVLPHKFVENTCAPLVDKVKSTAVAVSLVKGFNILPRGGITLISEMLRTMLKIEVCVLMGANLAREVAAGEFCESTLGCKDLHVGKLLKKLFQTDNFRISVVDDISSIEVCGALKNIVAVGAGLVDGLKYGGNTKAAVMRIGFNEMIRYAKHFYPESKIETFLESCGIADLITSCYGGRNRQIGEAFVETGKPMEELEKEMLEGQRMQGPQTAEEVMLMLKKKGEIKKFPFLVTVHHICTGKFKPPQIIDCIRSYPEHLS